MSALADWSRFTHTADGHSFDVYQRGSGPGVIVIHEIPGLTPQVVGFADEVVAAGYTVYLPHLFGNAGVPTEGLDRVAMMGKLCVSREFTVLAAGVTAPLADWLRSLSRLAHAECGGAGVGALGMCLTGGFALAMMIDDGAVTAPVLAQPAAPFPIGKRRAADLNLSPADTEKMVARAQAGCPVLGLRFEGDPPSKEKFARLSELLGENFIRVEFPGAKHSTLTVDRQQAGVDAVLAFFADRLKG